MSDTVTTKLALVEKSLVDLEAWRRSVHDKNGETHKELSLMRLEIQEWRIQTQQLINDQQEMKDVIKNNTSALTNIQEILNKLTTSQETTRSNIRVASKSVLWTGGVISMFYTTYKLLQSLWGK